MRNSEFPRASIFGLDIDRVSMKQAVQRLYTWIAAGDRSCRYVVTPNLDHAIQHRENRSFREAYASASMVVADGWPIVTASRLFRDPLPERVAGSDLLPALFSFLNQVGVGSKVFLLGAAPGVAETAARKIEEQWPTIQVVGTYSPPLGFENDPAESIRILKHVNACSPDILVVAFGAPKQELWLEKFHRELSVGVAIAAGATIDFIAGRQTRAPEWMRRMRLEWSHRLLTNPRRLAARYARNAWSLPRMILQEHACRKERKLNPQVLVLPTDRRGS